MQTKSLRINQVAILMGISVNLIRKYCNRGMLPFWLMPETRSNQKHRHRRFELQDVYDFMKRHDMCLTKIHDRHPHLKEEPHVEETQTGIEGSGTTV